MAGGFALMNTIGNLLGGFGGQYAIGLLRQQTGSYVTGFAALSGCALATALIVLAVGRAITRQITSLAVPAE
jgi:cyanate permease